MVPGLLPIFLHGCEIKSGSGLGTRLHTLNMERDEQLLTVQNSAYFDQFPSLILQQTACYSHSEREGGEEGGIDGYGLAFGPSLHFLKMNKIFLLKIDRKLCPRMMRNNLQNT